MHAALDSPPPSVRHTQLFFMYYERHVAEVKRMGECAHAKENGAFKQMPFECASNGIQGSFQWSKLQV